MSLPDYTIFPQSPSTFSKGLTKARRARYNMGMSNFTSNKTVIKIIVASLAVLLILLIVALIVNLVKLSAANKRKADLAKQSAYLDTLINENGAMIDYCQTPEFIEDYARDYLDMIYRNEIPVEVK